VVGSLRSLPAVHIASDRTYRFDEDPARLWAQLAGVDRYPTWWPWLHRFEADELVTGARWRCTVQPPLPYSLTFTIAIREVVPLERVAAVVSGEIEGSAEVALAAEPAGGTTVRLQSRLAPSSRFLQAVAMVARPVVSLGHDWVLDTGAKQFRTHLAADGTG
jgi:uncharacterized protein YndB with AHSA1/START domain